MSPSGRKVRLPLPEIQIFGGGAHAGRRIDLQDLMVMPVGAQSFDEALAMVAEVYRTAGELMARSGSPVTVSPTKAAGGPTSTTTKPRSRCSRAPSTSPAIPGTVKS